MNLNLQGVDDGAAGPSCSSDLQKTPSISGTTAAATLLLLQQQQQQLLEQQQRQREEAMEMSLELTLSFAYM